MREAKRADTSPPVRHSHTGRHRHQDNLAQHHQGLPQGRDGQVLRRRHLPQAQAPRQAEKGKETYETGRRRGGATEGIPRSAEDISL